MGVIMLRHGSVNVLDNDTVESARISSYTVPAKGTAAVNGGVFTYIPTVGAYGTDTFDYTLTNAGGSSTATVTVTIDSLIDIDLLNDSNHDGATNDARFTAIIGPVSTGSAVLQLDADGNGTFEISQTIAVSTSDVTNVVVSPSGLVLGSRPVVARVVVAGQAGPAHQLDANLTATVAPDIQSLVVHNGANTGTQIPPMPGQDVELPETAPNRLLGFVSGTGNDISFVKIEFDQDMDGLTIEGTATSNKDGVFAYDPEGLPRTQTTVRARSAVLDQITGVVRHGNWYSLNFTPDSRVVAKVDTLKLLDDPDNDGASSRPEVEGTLAADSGIITMPMPGTLQFPAILANVTVEVDVGGDGIVDGETATDSDGKFQYYMVGLTPGNYVVKARSRQWDDILNSEVFSSWKTVSVQILTYAAATLTLDEFKLVNDTGTSNTDNVTSDPTVTGHFAEGNHAANVLVQFSHSTSGSVAGSATTNSDGQFTYVPVGLSAGAHTVQARTRRWDSVSQTTLTSAWTPLTFTLTTATGQPTVVWNTTSTGGTTGTTTSTLPELDPGTDTAATTYNGAVHDADQDRQDAIQDAINTFTTVLNNATNTYNSALTTAQNNLNTALATWTGDTSSIPTASFGWQDVPAHLEWDDPADTAPADSMYDIPEANVPLPQFELTPQFRQQSNAAQGQYATRVRSADSGLRSDEHDAQTQFDDAVAAAENQYEDDVMAAELQQAATLANYDPTQLQVALDAITQVLSGVADPLMQSIAVEQEKLAALPVQTDYQAQRNTAAAQYSTDMTNATTVAAQKAALHTYQTSMADIARAEAGEKAEVRRDTQKRLIGLQGNMNLLTIQAERAKAYAIANDAHLKESYRVVGQKQYETLMATAEQDYAHSLADAQRDYRISMATASNAHRLAMVNAQIGAANGQLGAVQAALSAWRAANPGPVADREWDTFQAHKAFTQSINTRMLQWVSLSNAQILSSVTTIANADRAEARGNADSAHSLATSRADDLNDRDRAFNLEDRRRARGLADATWKRESDNTTARVTFARSEADDEYDFDIDKGDAEQQYAHDVADANQNFDYGSTAYNTAMTNASNTRRDSLADAKHDRTDDAADNRDVWSSDRRTAITTSRKSENLAEASWDRNKAEHQFIYDNAVAPVQETHQLNVDANGETAYKAGVAENKTLQEFDNDQRAALAQFQAEKQGVLDITLAAAQQKYSEAIATTYQGRLQSWDASVNTPFSQYALDVANAQLSRLNSSASQFSTSGGIGGAFGDSLLGGNDSPYLRNVQALAAAGYNSEKEMSDEIDDRDNKAATAAKDRGDKYATATKDRLDAIATAEKAWAQGVAHDTLLAKWGQADLRRDLADFIADKAEAMQGTLDSAYKTKVKDDATSQCNLDKTLIDSTQHQTNLDAHQAFYDGIVVGAERNYASLVATERKLQQDAILDNEQGRQASTAARDRTRATANAQAEKDYADSVAEAEKDYATTMANDDLTYTNDVAGFGETSSDDQLSISQQYENTDVGATDTFDAAERQSFGTYQTDTANSQHSRLVTWQSTQTDVPTELAQYWVDQANTEKGWTQSIVSERNSYYTQMGPIQNSLRTNLQGADSQARGTLRSENLSYVNATASNQNTRALQAAGFTETYLKNLGTLQQTRVDDLGKFQADAREQISQSHIDARKSFATASKSFVIDVSTDYQASVTGNTTLNAQPRRDAFSASQKTARHDRAQGVGEAWQGLQTNVGTAATTFATGYNGEVTTLLGNLQGMPTLSDSVEQNWATNSGNARRDQAVNRATAEKNFVQSQNLKWTTYSQNLQTANLNRANSEATNWTTYQHDRAQRERDEANAAYLADPTNITLRDADAVAEGQLAWVNSVQSNYTSDVNSRELAELSYQNTATTARNQNAYNVALAQIIHATDTGNADTSLDYNLVVDGQASTTARRGFSNTWSNTQATKDGTQRTGSVTNQNDSALNFIHAEKTFREDKYGAGANQTTHDAAVGTAQTGFNRGAVDQSSLWQNDSAQTDWSFDHDSVTRDKSDAINEANRYQANDTAWANYDKTLLLAQIGEDVTEAGTLSTAKYQRSLSLANAEASYRGAQFGAELAGWTAVDLVLANAWSDAKKDEASAKSSAWSSVSSQFVTKETNIAAAEQTARGTLSSEYDTMATETAGARRDGSVAQAGVDVSVATARATAGETYGNGIADATRDWQQLDAWTKRHGVWGTADTTNAPNSTNWTSTVGGAETAYFNATAQASRDEVTGWGTTHLAQVDREALAGKTNEQNSAEAVRVRDNAVEGYEEAFDLAWSNALNSAVQSAMTAGATPWHDYLGAVTLADHDLVTGTRPDELTLATAQNDAEQDYQSSVSDARETLLHDRAVAEIQKVHDQTEEDITAAQTKFNAREATQAPDSLEYSSGFEEGFPSRPRPKVEYADPNNTGMPYTPPNYAEPPGFGLYEDGAEKPWGDLINPPGNTLGTPPPPGPTFIPWFAQGYEPEWGDNVNNPMQSMYGDAHDEYGDSVDNQWDVPGEMGYSASSSYDLNSPTSVFGRGESQTEWETTAGGNTQTQWWNAAMPSVYAGFTGPTINGNTLVATLNNALNGAAGVDLPDPPASTLVTPPPPPEEHEGESELPPPPPPPDPTTVGDPQATPGSNIVGQGKSNTQQKLEARPFVTTGPTGSHNATPARDSQVAMGEAHAPTRTVTSGAVSTPPMAGTPSLGESTKGVAVPKPAPAAEAPARLRSQIDQIVKEMNKLRDDYVAAFIGSSAHFDECVNRYEGGRVLERGNAGNGSIIRFVALRQQLKQLTAQWKTMTGGPSPVANPMHAGETWEQRFNGRLAVAKAAVATITTKLNQIRDRQEQAAPGEEVDISDLVDDIEASVVTFNAAIKEAYSIYNRGLVNWREAEKLFGSGLSLGAVGMSGAEELTFRDRQGVGDRLHATGDFYDRLDTAVTVIDWIGTTAGVLSGVGAAGVVYKMAFKEVAKGAGKAAYVKVTLKATAKLAGGVAVGMGGAMLLDQAGQAAGLSPTGRQIFSLGIDIASIILTRRKMKANPPTAKPDANPATPHAKPVGVDDVGSDARLATKTDLEGAGGQAGGPQPHQKQGGGRNSATAALDDSPPSKPPLPPAQSDEPYSWPGHKNAADAEAALARTVHDLPDQAVVRWGDKIGTHGSDVISVNIKTGEVTLWDSKFRSGDVRVQPSKTFSDPDRRTNAIRQATEAIEANTTLPAKIRAAALRNLENLRITTRTVGAGNAKNSTLQ